MHTHTTNKKKKGGVDVSSMSYDGRISYNYIFEATRNLTKKIRNLTKKIIIIALKLDGKI